MAKGKQVKVKLTQAEEEALSQGYHLREMVATKGYSEVLKAELESGIKRELFDPEQFTNLDDIAKAYIIRYTENKVASWIFEFIDKIEQQTQFLEKKQKGELIPDKFNIGG